MADIAVDNPPGIPRKRSSFVSIVLPPLLFCAAVIMAADFAAIELAPLHVLHIPYAKAMDFAPLIIPGSCALIWLATVRKWPNAGSIMSVLLCFVLISQIPAYAQRRVARLPVTRWLRMDEARTFESHNGFAICQTGSSDGLFVIVAPENAGRARDELDRLGVELPDRVHAE
jgi:hypothetical protein